MKSKSKANGGAMGWLGRWMGWVALWVVLGWGARAEDGGEQVAVVYSRQIPESRELARYYAEKRGVPKANLIEVDVPLSSTITRAEYQRLIEKPVLRAIEEQGLLEMDRELLPAAAGKPGGVRYRCKGGKLRYVVMTWGLPYRIANDPQLVDAVQPPEMNRNNACVDSDLCLLPALGHFPFLGAVNNLAYRASDPAMLHGTNHVLMVTRLDGPTPAKARALLDRALQAEKEGLWGRVYIDLRSIGGNYALGDQFITNAAVVSRAAGFETILDAKESLFPLSYPMGDIALYAGWYSGQTTGPFARPEVEFRPGAIGYHLHSFSASDLRSTNLYWVGPMIDRGVTATMGCIDEPYLGATPNIGLCFERLYRGWTWGEAAYASLPALSWQTVVVGDPLYRPFGPTMRDWYDRLQSTPNDPRWGWYVLRVANQRLANGNNPAAVMEYIQSQAGWEKSSVLREKLAVLAVQREKYLDAIGHYREAARMELGPMEKLRILLELGALETQARMNTEAYATYARAIRECHLWIDQLTVRKQQVLLARELKKAGDLPFLESEVKRLSGGQ